VKIRSAEELEDSLDKDLVWRRKEFTTLKFMVKDARNHEKEILLRASIALLYAHWEGHVKHCSMAYINYLNSMALKYNDLKDNFFQMSLGEKFSQGFSIKRFSSQRELCEYVNVGSLGDNFSIAADSVIDTESNLKSEVLFNILEQLGLDCSMFELKKQFIDAKLLKCRNAIAHGSKVNDVEMQDAYSELENELLSMIVVFHNLVKNAVNSRSFMKNTA
jgi:hypothetical protein